MKKIFFLVIAFSCFSSFGQCNVGNCQPIPINKNLWSESHGTPTFGNNSVFLWSYTTVDNLVLAGEGVNYSGYNFLQGQQYCVSVTINATTNTDEPPNVESTMNVILTQGAVIGNGTEAIPRIPDLNQMLMDVNIWGDGKGNMDTYEFSFTANENFNNLWFFPSNPALPQPQIEAQISNLIICCIPDTTTITANEKDITDTLTATIPCNQNCITLNATNITDAVYDTTALIDKDLKGIFCIPPGSSLTSFMATITGTDSCGSPYEEEVTINLEPDVISPEFIIDGYECNKDGTYNVKVTASDDNSLNQWWRLRETTQQGETQGGENVGDIQDDVTTTFFNLDPDKFYYITHAVWNDCVSFTGFTIALDPPCCKEPTTIIANGTVITKNTFTIPCDEDSVTINVTNITHAEYSTTNLGVTSDSNGVFNIIDPNLSSFTLTITGTDSCGEPYNEKVTIHIAKDCCHLAIAPENVAYDYDNNVLTWDKDPNADRYVIKVTWNAMCCRDHHIIPDDIIPSVTTFNVSNYGLTRYELPYRLSNCFTIEVAAICNDTYLWSKPICINGYIDEERPINLDISPNPSKGNLNITIRVEKDAEVLLKILRFDGTLVKTVRNLKTTKGILTMDYQSNLSSGLYFFNFSINNKLITKKIIIE